MLFRVICALFGKRAKPTSDNPVYHIDENCWRVNSLDAPIALFTYFDVKVSLQVCCEDYGAACEDFSSQTIFSEGFIGLKLVKFFRVRSCNRDSKCISTILRMIRVSYDDSSFRLGSTIFDSMDFHPYLRSFH